MPCQICLAKDFSVGWTRKNKTTLKPLKYANLVSFLRRQEASVTPKNGAFHLISPFQGPGPFDIYTSKPPMPFMVFSWTKVWTDHSLSQGMAQGWSVPSKGRLTPVYIYFMYTYSILYTLCLFGSECFFNNMADIHTSLPDMSCVVQQYSAL